MAVLGRLLAKAPNPQAFSLCVIRWEAANWRGVERQTVQLCPILAVSMQTTRSSPIFECVPRSVCQETRAVRAQEASEVKGCRRNATQGNAYGKFETSTTPSSKRQVWAGGSIPPVVPEIGFLSYFDGEQSSSHKCHIQQVLVLHPMPRQHAATPGQLAWSVGAFNALHCPLHHGA